MKIEVKENEVKASSKYPYLGIFEDKSFIVLFIKETTGCVVWTNEDSEGVNELSDNWLEHKFTPFNGTITLSND